MKRLFYLVMLVLTVTFISNSFGIEVRSVKKGNWSDPTTWSTNAVPGPTDDVKIMADTVTYDMDSSMVNNIEVGDGTAGVWQTSKLKVTKLTVTGNILVNAGAGFKATTVDVTSGLTGLDHMLYLHGNITNNGNGFDFRAGTSGSTLGTIKLVLMGTTNTTITMNGTYTSGNGEYNAWVINKTGGAKVLIATDVFISGGSSAAPLQQSVLTFINGYIETVGNAALVHMSTTAANSVGGSKYSHVVGTLGRGLSSSAGATKEFMLGDGISYRPFKVMSTTSGGATGHNVRVAIIKGNANTGSSTFPDGKIDKVSTLRYYKVTYSKGPVAGPPNSMTLARFEPAYSTGDGLKDQTTNLRVAYSTDERASWMQLPDTRPDTVRLIVDSVRFVGGDTLTTPFVLNDAGPGVYFALARLTGATDITLDGIDTDVKDYFNATPVKFNLSQNYPNPFNPTTSINYSILYTGFVSLKIYDMLGNEIRELVGYEQKPGNYKFDFDASGLSSGIYFYKLSTPGFTQTKKMQLLK